MDSDQNVREQHAAWHLGHGLSWKLPRSKVEACGQLVTSEKLLSQCNASQELDPERIEPGTSAKRSCYAAL